MKFILFIILLGAFILHILHLTIDTGIVGLTITNISFYLVGLTLIITEILGGNLSGKKLTGVNLAVIISVATIFSLIYAQIGGAYSGTFLDNLRLAKAFVFEPALLYGLAFLLVDTRDQGERYLLYLVIVMGMLNVAAVIGAKLGLQIYQAAEARNVEVEGSERLVGFIGNPNKTAYLTCILIAFQYYFYRFHKSYLIRYLMAILMLAGLAVVFLSGSRGGLLVLVIVILSLAYRLRDMKVVYGAVLLIPVMVGVLLIAESTLLENSIGRVEVLTSGDASEVTSGRNLIWSALLSDYTNSFFGMLFGYGFGASKAMGIRAEPHNIYLMVLVEFGIIGLGLFICFIATMFRHVARVLRSGDDALSASILASGYVVVFAWIFTTLIGVLDLIWFTIGISMATLFSANKQAIRQQQHTPGMLLNKKRPPKLIDSNSMTNSESDIR